MRKNVKGSALVLVIVLLVLMTLLGAAYLQLARVDREAGRITYASHIDQVVAATVAYLQTMLRDNVVDAQSGIFFDPDTSNGKRGLKHYTYPSTNATVTNKWLANTVQGANQNKYAAGGQFDDTYLSTTVPNFDAKGQNATWAHLTNLYGTRFDLPAYGNLPKVTQPTEYVLDGANPNQPASDGNRSDTNVLVTYLHGSTDSTKFEPRGTDATGCGVEDAYWTRAPIWCIGDTCYVMGVRVIDNSSMLNLMTASALGGNTAADQDNAAAGSPRGYFPSDVDLTKLLARALRSDQSSNGTPGPDWTTELPGDPARKTQWPGLLGYRTNAQQALTGLPVPTGLGSPLKTDNNTGLVDLASLAGAGRAGSWVNWGRDWAWPKADPQYQFLSPAEELDLRTHYDLVGLGSSKTILSSLMPNLLRTIDPNTKFGTQTPRVELNLTDIKAVGGPLPAGDQALLAYYLGGVNGSLGLVSDPKYTFPAIRHFLTCYSGDAVWAANPNGIFAGPGRTLRYDLNRQDRNVPGAVGDGSAGTVKLPDRVKNLHDRVKGIFALGMLQPAGKDTDPCYCYLADALKADFSNANGGTPPKVNNANGGNDWDDLLEHLSWEYALAIQSYSDPDPLPLAKNVMYPPAGAAQSTITYCSLKPLPFLRQVYLQMAYYDTASVPPTPPDPPKGDTFTAVTPADYALPDTAGPTGPLERQAVAIEIGNPFLNLVKGSGLKDHVRVVLMQPGKTADNAGTPKWTFDNTVPDLKPGDKIVLYCNPLKLPSKDARNQCKIGNGTTPNATGLNTNTQAALVKMPDGALTFDPVQTAGDTTKDVTIELQVQVKDVDSGDATQWVTYDRLTLAGFNLPLTVDHKGNPTTPPVAAPPPAVSPLADVLVNGQVFLYRDCTPNALVANRPGTRFLSNIGKTMPAARDLTTGLSNPNDPKSDAQAAWAAKDAANFGLDTKVPAASGDADMDKFEAPMAQRQFLNVTELGMIQMFGFRQVKDSSGNVAALGDFPQRLDGPGPGSADTTGRLDPRRRNLDLSSQALVAAVGATAPDARLPHAALLLDTFTTLSPRYDNQDNDNDGKVDAESEQLIPGRININTVPLPALVLGLDLPSGGTSPETLVTTEQLARKIAAYRDHPEWRQYLLDVQDADTTRNSQVYWRNGQHASPSGLPADPDSGRKGIASLTELLFLNGDATGIDKATNPPDPNDKALGDALKADEAKMVWSKYAGGAVPGANLYPAPEELASQGLAGQPALIAGSNKARLARFQFLSQILTTRSDVFTAYVVIRGYPAGDWSQGPVESARFVVVFDRSNLTSKSDTVRIVGFVRLN